MASSPSAIPSSPSNILSSPSASPSRRRGNVSSEESAPLPGIVNGIYRAATGRLRPLPLESTPLPKNWYHAEVLQSIVKEVTRVLDECGIREPAYIDTLKPQEDPHYGFDDGDEESWETGYVSIVNRHPSGDPAAGQETVLIVSDWKATSLFDWPAALLKVQIALSQLPGAIPSLDLEMIATQRVRELYIYPIMGDKELERHWNSTMLMEVKNKLQAHNGTKGLVNTIVLSRLGHFFHPTKNPVTIWIGMAYESDETTWPPVIDTISEYLKSISRPIKIRIEHSQWKFPAFTLVPPTNLTKGFDDDKPYQQRVNLGADLSGGIYPRGPGGPMNSLLGTLGCFVKVHKDGVWATYALTNYHVIRPLLGGFSYEKAQAKTKAGTKEEGVLPNKVPPKNSPLHRADLNGIDMIQGSKLAQMEHPSRLRHNRVMANLAKAIDQKKRFVEEASKSALDPAALKLDPQKAKLEKEKQYEEKKAFFDKGQHILGRVVAASGWMRKSHQQHRLDWALIEVNPSRVGSNKLPDSGIWEAAGRADDEPGTSKALDRLQDCNEKSCLANTDNGDARWKMGAATGPTRGIYSGYRSFCGVRECEYLNANLETWEHNFVPVADQKYGLGDHGDSGSIVYDGNGVAVGLLFRGSGPSQAKDGIGYTMVTPLEDVFADIKTKLQAQDVMLA